LLQSDRLERLAHTPPPRYDGESRAARVKEKKKAQPILDSPSHSPGLNSRRHIEQFISECLGRSVRSHHPVRL
jgi:hypothetical protein